MKKAKKIGLVSAFCSAMLSLTACTRPASVYGPPPEDESKYDLSSAEDVQDVYGPPVGEDTEVDASDDEASLEESYLDPADNIPSLVYGPPPALEENAPKIVPE